MIRSKLKTKLVELVGSRFRKAIMEVDESIDPQLITKFFRDEGYTNPQVEKACLQLIETRLAERDRLEKLIK